MTKDYYQLTKPGIIYGNTITAAAGFLLASRGHIRLGLFMATLLGVSMLIASGCVFNNYLDRELDSRMARTKKRALVTGAILGHHAIIFATLLGAAGFIILARYVNMLTVLLGAIALIAYVIVYGYAKRRSVHGTLIGSIAGSMSLVAGYCAVTNRFDEGAWILFLILAAWQMPHFYAIAVFRKKDYAAAGIPVLPVVRGVRAAKVQMLAYILIFVLAAITLAVRGFAGYLYTAVVVLAGLWWLGLSIRGFYVSDDIRWARQLFGFSLVVLIIFSFMISVDAWVA